MNELQFIALPDDVLFHIAGKIGEFTSMEYLSQTCRALRELLTCRARSNVWHSIEVCLSDTSQFASPITRTARDFETLSVEIDPRGELSQRLRTWIEKRARGFKSILVMVSHPIANPNPNEILSMSAVLDFSTPIINAAVGDGAPEVSLQIERFLSLADFKVLISRLLGVKRKVELTLGLDELVENSLGIEEVPEALIALRQLAPVVSSLGVWTPIVPLIDFQELLVPLPNLNVVSMGNSSTDRTILNSSPPLALLSKLPLLEGVDWHGRIQDPKEIEDVLPTLTRLKSLALFNVQPVHAPALVKVLPRLERLSDLILRFDDEKVSPTDTTSPLSALPPLRLPASCGLLSLELAPAKNRNRLAVGSVFEGDLSFVHSLSITVDDISGEGAFHEHREIPLALTIGSQLSLLTNLKSLKIEGSDLVRQTLMITLPKELSALTALTSLCVAGADVGGVTFPRGALPRTWSVEALSAKFGRLTYGMGIEEDTEAVMSVEEEVLANNAMFADMDEEPEEAGGDDEGAEAAAQDEMDLTDMPVEMNALYFITRLISMCSTHIAHPNLPWPAAVPPASLDGVDTPEQLMSWMLASLTTMHAANPETVPHPPHLQGGPPPENIIHAMVVAPPFSTMLTTLLAVLKEKAAAHAAAVAAVDVGLAAAFE